MIDNCERESAAGVACDRKSGGKTAALHKNPDVTYNLNVPWKELG
jgi:hypothetical protein